MSSIRISPDFLKRIARLRISPEEMSRDLMPELERIAWEDNRDGLLAGTDKDGQPLAPLAASTLKNRARGSGGPLVPNGRRSRAIANYRVSHVRLGGGFVIIGSWQNMLSHGTPIMPFHLEGRGRNPKRDVAGVRPTGKAKIRAAMLNWYRAKIK